MVKIGLIGFGNVGQSVVSILEKNATLLEQRTGQAIRVKRIVVRNIEKYKPLLPDSIELSTDFNSLIEDPEISIIVELIGGEFPAFDYISRALKAKKYVVTANKEVISKHKKAFFKLAKENQVDIFFEAAVAGGIPIIRSLKVGFSANKIEALYGIVNGTTNYILTKISEEKKEFQDVLKEAQQLGFAEADPTMDISGLDAAHKLVILAAVAFKVDVPLSSVFYEGIESISLKDILYANELGYCIKLLAIGRRAQNEKMTFKVHPTMIPLDHPLATVRNEMNAVFLKGNAVGEVMLSGKGAGGSPTGSAVISDIIDIAFDQTHNTTMRNLEPTLNPTELMKQEEIQSQFYVRIFLKDHPSMLEKVTGTLGSNAISISKILQKNIQDDTAELVIVTHASLEKDMHSALHSLQTLEGICSIETLIRVRLDEN